MTAKTLTSKKSAKILSVVRAVERAPFADAVEVVDHWTADRHAIGFRSVKRNPPLMYVSTWKQPDGHYFWSLERKTGETQAEGVAPGLDALLALISQSLVESAAAGSPTRRAAQKASRARSA